MIIAWNLTSANAIAAKHSVRGRASLGHKDHSVWRWCGKEEEEEEEGNKCKIPPHTGC